MLKYTQQQPLPKPTPGVKLPVRRCGGMGSWREAIRMSLPSCMGTASMSVAQSPCQN